MMTQQDFRKTPPPVVGMTPMTLPRMTSLTTPGGIEMRLLNRPDLQMLYLTAIVEGGNAEALSPALPSIQTAVAREGTADYSADQIASILEYAGASLRMSGLSHHRRFSIFALEKTLPQVIPVFADIVCRPTFPERETRVRCETFAGRFEVAFNSVGFLANSESERQMMGNTHPLALVDTPADIRKISPKQLLSFTESFRSPASLTLYLCGNLTDEMIQLIADAFDSRIFSSPATKLNIRPFSPAPPTDRRLTLKSDASQSAIFLTLPTIPRSHPDYIPLHLTVYALGGYFGSRLMRNIREDKGLTYGIQAGLCGYREGSFLNISAEADNSYVNQVIDQVRIELSRLASDPSRGEELRRIRQSALSSHASALDSPVTVTDTHIDAQTLALPADYFNAKQKAIESFSADIIARMAETYLNPDLLRISIAGNPADE